MSGPAAIVIVTYNAERDIVDCITDLEGTARVIVIDNASTDGTADLLRGLSSRGLVHELILGTDNLGFAKAVNIGLERAGAGDVLLLNPDARIAPDAVAALASVAEDPRMGIVSPLVDNGPGVMALGAGEQPRLWPMFTHFSGLARLFPRVRTFRGRYLYRATLDGALTDTGWVSGGCLYLAARARAAVGQLSERWFMYGEDVDLCRRVTEAGFRVVVARDIPAFHAIGGSANESTGAVSTMWATSTLDYYRTAFSAGPVAVFVWRLMFSGGLVARSILLRVRALLRRDAAMRARARRFARFARAVWTA